MGIKNTVKQLLTRRLDSIYERRLSEKKTDYKSWVGGQEKNISDAVGSGTETFWGDFVLFCQKDGKLNLNAESWIRAYFATHEECLILYGDEDVMGEDGIRENPWYKPCWSPDLYLDFFYPGSVIAVRRAFAERVLLLEKPEDGSTIIFNSAADIRERMDELFYAAGGFEKGSRSIERLPAVLFHADDSSLWETYMSLPARGVPGGEKTVRESDRTVKEKEITIKEKDGLVSVIIPSKDNPDVLSKCLNSLEKFKDGQELEIIVVDNGSSPQNRKILEKLTQGMTYLYSPMEFNFSAMCNMGVQSASGSLLLFLNDDVEMCEEGWLRQMRDKAVQPYVGAAGLKLRYPDSAKIQHTGITNLPVGPVHKLQFFDDNKSYYFGRNKYNHNCLAVTGACLMIEKKKLQEVGYFCEELKIAYNDVDLGFRLWEAGYQNVVVNHCYAVHHESLSRGSDETWEKQERLERERELLYKLHPKLDGDDPYYPKQLNIEGLDSRILPGYITSGNTMQPSCWQSLPKHLTGYREDACLMVRVEAAGPEKIQGYSVILGDDNACYDKYLLVDTQAEPGSGQVSGQLFCMKLEAQYRDDLEENLPDQKNVAMGGFRVSPASTGLMPGVYRIGVLAVHKISGLKLLGWSGRFLRVA